MQLVEGSVKVPLDSGFVTAEAGEDIGIAGVFAEDEGVKVIRSAVFVPFREKLRVVVHAKLEEGGFHGADAVEAPGVHYDLG